MPLVHYLGYIRPIAQRVKRELQLTVFNIPDHAKYPTGRKTLWISRNASSVANLPPVSFSFFFIPSIE